MQVLVVYCKLRACYVCLLFVTNLLVLTLCFVCLLRARSYIREDVNVRLKPPSSLNIILIATFITLNPKP